MYHTFISFRGRSKTSSEHTFAFENASAFSAFAFFFVNSVPSVDSVHALISPVLDIGLNGALGVKRHGSQLLPLVLTYRRQNMAKEVITKSSTCGLYGRLGLIIQHASTCRPTAHETNVINDCCKVFLVSRSYTAPLSVIMIMISQTPIVWQRCTHLQLPAAT